jgi:glycosyltransferase involved in cell wall biosynthesis
VWHNQDKHFKLLIITRDIHAAGNLLSNLSESLSKSIQIISANHNEIPDYLSIAAASLFFIKNSFSKTASSPTKMAESWAVNIPIITNSGIGDNDIYFEKNLGGALIKGLNEESYLKAYHEFKNLPASNYRNIAETNFDKDEAIKRYLIIYNQILKPKK